MKRVWQQLRDRHVVKVAAAYLVAAWLVLQLADVIFPALNLPEWSVTLTLGLLAAGFPIAMVLAWVFDITSDGIQRTAPVLAGRSDGGAARAPASDYSIAVLPLQDMSAERDQGHFCDGLTEELLNVLTCIPNLRVASRTSSFAFKDSNTDIATIAGKLRVAYILEGSVRKDGAKVRISAQLIEVATDSHLWSETYDRQLCDVFAIQDDIASRVLGALKLKLGSVRLPGQATGNAKAYEYYLRGRGYYFTKTDRDVARAVEMFRRATGLDPAFVRAWSDLAEASATHALFLGGGEAAVDIAVHASNRAMRLAPDQADSFMARGFAHLAARRFADAEADFLGAVQRDPEQVRAWHYLARAARHLGDKDKALRYFTKATELDPEDWESPLIAIGDYQEIGDTEGATRMARIGVQRVERHLEDYPDNPRAYYLSLAALALLGDSPRAEQFAAKALAIAGDDPPTRYNLACYYARIGETEKALDLLESSIRTRSWIENDPDLDSIRGHPRYQTLVESLRAGVGPNSTPP